MQKRRERIERWRAERKKKELDSVKKDVRTSIMCKSFNVFVLIFFTFVLSIFWYFCVIVPQNKIVF